MTDLFGEPEPGSYVTKDGREIAAPKRGKHYVAARGGADRPGTGPVGETCGSCQHHVVRQYARAYHKCALNRSCWTGGRKTDILVRWPACSKWEKIEDETPVTNHDAGDAIR